MLQSILPTKVEVSDHLCGNCLYYHRWQEDIGNCSKTYRVISESSNPIRFTLPCQFFKQKGIVPISPIGEMEVPSS